MTDRELEAYLQAQEQARAQFGPPEPLSPDDHLEAEYDGRYDSYLDQYDDDPSPYSGTYSEE